MVANLVDPLVPNVRIVDLKGYPLAQFIRQWDAVLKAIIAAGSGGGGGTEIELQTSATHIQWRHVGDAVWIDLVALADLVGPAGPTGPQGDPNVDEQVGGGGDVAINSTSYVTLASWATSVEVGDRFIIECDFIIHNNSGGTKTYTYALAIGAFLTEVLDGTTVAANATSKTGQIFHASAEIRSTSLNYASAATRRASAVTAANTSQSVALVTARQAWNTSASDLTGDPVTIAVQIKSDNATATQTAIVLGWRIRRIR